MSNDESDGRAKGGVAGHVFWRSLGREDALAGSAAAKSECRGNLK